MIAAKAIQSSYGCSNYTHFGSIKDRHFSSRVTINRNSPLCLCKSNDSDSSEAPPPEGDSKQQELLARMALLQTEKARLTGYLDETSNYLSKFAEDANAEFDKIRAEARKALEEVGDTVEANMELQKLEYEESAESNKLEIQESENIVTRFEEQMESERNDGLFFKNLRQKPPTDKVKAQEEMEKIEDVTKENAGSKTRKNIYLFFMGLVTVGIVDSVIASSIDWRKVAALAAIFVALLTQFIYEQNISSESKTENETDGK